MSTIVDLDADGLARCLGGNDRITTTIGRLRDYWGSDPDEWGMLGPLEWSDEEVIGCDLRAVWEDEWVGELDRVEVWFERDGGLSEAPYVCIDRPHEITDIPPEAVCEHASPVEKARLLRVVLDDSRWIAAEWIEVLTSEDDGHELPPTLLRDVWDWARTASAAALCSLLKTPTMLDMLELTAEDLVPLLSDDRQIVRQAALQALEHVPGPRAPMEPDSPTGGAR